MDEESTPPATEGRIRRERSASDGAVDAATDRERLDARGELRETIVEALRTLPTQSKLVLLAVLARDRTVDGGSSTGEVYNAYEGLCTAAPVDPLSQRRVTDLLDELDTFGLVSAAVVSEGRYGRTREIEGAIAPEPARSVLLADERLGDLAAD